MIALTTVFGAIKRAAEKSKKRPDALTPLNRRVFYAAQKSGRAISPQTAQMLITVSRQLIAPDIAAIKDNAGRTHFAADYADQANAEISRLRSQLAAARGELIQLRRVIITRCRQ